MLSQHRILPVLLFALAVSGCGSEPENTPPPGATTTLTPEGLEACREILAEPVLDPPNRVLIAWDATASRTAIGLPEQLRQDIVDASLSGGALTIVAVEGEGVAARPVVVDRALNTPGDLSRPSVGKLAQILPACVGEIFTEQVAPQSSGSDIYEALGVLGDHVAQSPGVPTKVWLLSDMVSTDGAVGLTPDLLAQDAQSAAEQVAPRAALDLHGVELHVDGLGSTHGELLTEHRAWLTTYAQALCETWNATGCEEIQAIPKPGDPRDVTDLPEDPTPVFPTAEPIPRGQDCTYLIPAHLTFAGDSAELRPGAGQILSEVTRQLLDNETARAIITGHTASSNSYTEQGLSELSLARAEAVATYLESQGVDPGRLEKQGLGDSEPLAEDIDPSTGLQIPEIAARERRVEITLEGVACSR